MFFIYLFEANFTAPKGILAESLVSQRWPLPTPSLLNLLVWFFGGSLHGLGSLAQESVDVSPYFLLELLKYDWIASHLLTPMNFPDTGDWSLFEGLVNCGTSPALD